MNFGDCPYTGCNGVIAVSVPEITPQYTLIKCEDCGRDVWYRLSRAEPMAWTKEAFEAEFVIDESSRTVKKKL